MIIEKSDAPNLCKYEKISSKEYFLVTALLLLALVLGPLRQLEFFAKMPGDMIDPRLNSYFLENIYLFFVGKSSSLIHLSFFYPYPFVLGFSDNLFGASPLYLIVRCSGFDPESSFQFWFICGFIVNYIATFFAIRMFGQSALACALGALIFSFGLPVTAQLGHAQLQYRFASPLAVAFFYRFLRGFDWRLLIVSFFWLVWQFFCSIYMGFFVSLLIVSMCVILRFLPYLQTRISARYTQNSFSLLELYNSFNTQNLRQIYKIITCFFLLSLFLVILLYPYFKVTQLYHFTRYWIEISAMLPRITSYFLADHSLIWGFISKNIGNLPIRWEQQLFIGVVPALTIIGGVIVGRKSIILQENLLWLFLSVILLVMITLNFEDYSLWKLFISLPLFSAIRAVSRIILIFLFPVSLFLAASIDFLLNDKCFSNKKLIAVICCALLSEICAVDFKTSLKSEWLLRRQEQARRLSVNLPSNSILFFAQKGSGFEGDELDAMLIAQKENLPTLNGYSGALPHHYHAEYGDDCAEYPRRILLYLDFLGQYGNIDAYQALAKRVAPIGFVGCNEDWRVSPPMTISNREMTRAELAALTLDVAPEGSGVEPGYIKIRIVNHGKQTISALSAIDKPIRLAWRVISSNRERLDNAEEGQKGLPSNCLTAIKRRDLPGDIPAGGFIDVTVPLPGRLTCGGQALEFAIAQEATIWGFVFDPDQSIWDAGSYVAPLRVSLPSK